MNYINMKYRIFYIFSMEYIDQFYYLKFDILNFRFKSIYLINLILIDKLN